MNKKPTELKSVLAVINPQSTATTVASGWVAVGFHHRMLASILVGALGSSATVNAKLQQAVDASGTSAKDITGAAITQIATTGNVQAYINLLPDTLDINGGFNYVQLSITVGTAASLVSGTLEGYAPRHKTGALYNAATVTQIVN